MRRCWGRRVREASLPHSFPYFSSLTCFLRRPTQGAKPMLRTSNNLNAASEFSRIYQTFLTLTDFQVSMVIFFIGVIAFVMLNSRHFLAELFWVVLLLNERNWILDTRTSGLFTYAPGCCVFVGRMRSRLPERTHLRHLGSNVALFSGLQLHSTVFWHWGWLCRTVIDSLSFIFHSNCS